VFLIAVQALFAFGTMEVLFDQYVRRMGSESYLKMIVTCGCRKKKNEEDLGNDKTTKVTPMKQFDTKHLGKAAALHHTNRKPLRGMKLLQNAARVMTGSFTRVEDGVRKKYEANRRKLKVHFKSAVQNRKIHKDLRIQESTTTQATLQGAMDAKTSSTTMLELENLITQINSRKESGTQVTKSVMDLVEVAKGKLYQMKTEIIGEVRTAIKMATKAHTAELVQVIQSLQASLNQLAESGIPDQEEMIEEGLQLMSEMEESLTLRKQLLQMKRQDLNMIVQMSAPAEVTVRVMEASCYLLGMKIGRSRDQNDWGVCRKWLKQKGEDVFDIIRKFDPTELTNEQIVSAASILADCTFEDAAKASKAVGLFFAFCSGMLYDVKVRMHNNAADSAEKVDVHGEGEEVEGGGGGDGGGETMGGRELREWALPAGEA
jgi:hypothetical protein